MSETNTCPGQEIQEKSSPRWWQKTVEYTRQWLACAPVSCLATLAVLLVGTAIHSGGFLWGRQLAADPLNFTPWSVLTAFLWGPSWGAMVNSALALLVLGGLLERFIGSRIWLISAVCGTLVGLAAVWLWVSIARNYQLGWMLHMANHRIGGVSIILVAVLAGASARMNQLWKRRTRFSLILLLAAFFAFFGGSKILACWGAFIAGLLVGVFSPSSLKNSRKQQINSLQQARLVVSAIFMVTTIGSLIAAWTFHASGPFLASRSWFSPELAEQQAILEECVKGMTDTQCLRQAYESSLAFYGPIVMATVPHLIQLVLAWGLWRGRRSAYIGTLIVEILFATIGLAEFFLFHFMREDLYDSVLLKQMLHIDASGFKLLLPVFVPVVIILLAAWNASAFRVRIPQKVWKKMAIRALIVFGFYFVLVEVIGLILSGFFAPRANVGNLAANAFYSLLPPSVQWVVDTPLFALSNSASIVTVWLPAAAWLCIAFFLIQALRTVPKIAEEKMEKLQALLHETGAGSLGWMLTWPGNSVWVSPDCRSAISYRASSGVALSLTEFATAQDNTEAAITQFSEFATSHSLTPALYSIHAPVARVAQEKGWTIVKIAEEAILDLTDLAFKGKKYQDIRTAFNHAKREGIEAVWANYQTLDADVRQQVEDISQAWAQEKALPEMGFTLGGIRELDDSETRLLLARDAEGKVHAATSWMPVYEEGKVVGLTLDFMRRLDGGFRLAIDFLIGRAALLAQEEGLSFLSLSGAPLAESGSCESEISTQSAAVFAPLLEMMGHLMEPVYGFRSLLAYKRKFQVRFVPLYLAVPDIADAPTVGLAIARAYLPHLSAVDTARFAAKLVNRE